MRCRGLSRRGIPHTEEEKRKISEGGKNSLVENTGRFKKQMAPDQRCSHCEKPAKYMTPEPCCAMHYQRHWYKYHRPIIEGKPKLFHRHIMEEFIGRKLTETEVVHHINGDRMDNRIENLQLMDRIDHLKMHARLRKEANR
jgi:hypothetical protein